MVRSSAFGFPRGGGTENVFVYYERLASETENPPSLAGTAIRRQTPKVGAVCLNWAHTPDFTPKSKNGTLSPRAAMRASGATVLSHRAVGD
jgi:hypothetical protein